MSWLRRNAWWGLLAIVALNAAVGLLSLVSGVWYQAEDVTGTSIDEVIADGASGARLAEFGTRMDGLHLLALGVVLGAVLLVPFRRNQAWAWWAMWILPGSILATSAVHAAFGATGPAISGTIVGGLAAAILLVSRSRFIGRPAA